MDKSGGVLEFSAKLVKKLKIENPKVFKWLVQDVYKKELSEIHGYTLPALLVGFCIGYKVLSSLTESEIMDLEDLYADCDKKTRDNVKYVEYLEMVISELADD